MSATLETLLGDAEARARCFPIVRQKVFLAHAAVAPLPAAVVDAISDYARRAGEGGQFAYLHREAEAEARRLAAAMIGAAPENIAFAPSTSAGLSMVAAGLPWQAGDEVVIARGDFPANTYPWLRLREAHGVRVRMLDLAEDDRIDADRLAPLLGPRTRLVALSSAHFATGTPLDIDAVGSMLQARGIGFCLDAIQTLGAMPCSAANVDFLVADAHKWLLGPQGIAILYVNPRRLSELEPVLVGWKSVQDAGEYHARELTYAAGAQRYEPGGLNILGVIGLHAALALLDSVGAAAIEAHLLSLRRYLLAALLQAGFELVGTSDPEARTPIIACRRDDLEMQQLYQQLDADGFVLSLRQDPKGRPCLRIAPHLYNTIDELDRLLEALPRG